MKPRLILLAMGIAAVAVPGGVPPTGYGGVTLPLDDPQAVLEFILSA